jgi:hypothetical protein
LVHRPAIWSTLVKSGRKKLPLTVTPMRWLSEVISSGSMTLNW